MRKVAEYLGWVIAFILGVSLTPLGWLPSALNLEPMEWLALVWYGACVRLSRLPWHAGKAVML